MGSRFRGRQWQWQFGLHLFTARFILEKTQVEPMKQYQ
jgi:hypothetical protein